VLKCLERDHELQNVPSLDDLEDELFGRKGEADGDDAVSIAEEPAPPPNLVHGSSLTRNATGSTAAQRRAQRRGAEPRHGE
jgi:hypothetical protein